ncbi:MAG: lipopolysaccharide heptosyltransferase II [Planctomycetes bacterium]|nr:lipopolysaccharide heptosyltransferase II [Planctomycetota bacterium]
MTLAVALPNWVGDAVMATPTLRALRRRFPDERIVAVTRPYVRPVLDPNPWTDAFIQCDKSLGGMWRAVKRLRREHAETGLLLPNSLRSALLFRLADVHRRIGYARECRSWLLTDAVAAPHDGRQYVPTPQITYYLALAEVLGAPTDDRRMELVATDEDDAATIAAFGQVGLDPAETLLLCPGYAFGPAKAWPVDHWAALARGARQRFGLRSAVLCSPKEAALAKAITDAADGCASLADKGITLASARAVVRMTRAMVAVDSGLRHYAAAFDKPVVALFGPTHVAWTETWHPKEVRLQATVPCGPCQQPVCPTGTDDCMGKIAPDEALDALAVALARD